MNLNKTRLLNFPRQHYFSAAPRQNYQIDLFDMTRNNTYLLVVVDVFSRKVDIEKIQFKRASSILEGLTKICERMGYPKEIQCDKEAGVYSKEISAAMSSKGVSVYSVQNSYHKHSAGIVERMNRTIKNYILNNNNGGKKQLPQMANEVVREFPKLYNNAVHSTTKIKPNDAFSSRIDDARIEQEQRVNEPVSAPTTKFSVGDVVIATIPKELISGKWVDKWYNIKYTVSAVQDTNPTTYKLQNEDGKDIVGSYYPQQLQLIKRAGKEKKKYIRTKYKPRDISNDDTEDEDEYQGNVRDLLN